MLDSSVKFFFALGVIAIPFDAIAGVNAFGELGNEGSFYFFFVAIGLHLCSAVRARLVGLPKPAANQGLSRIAFMALATIVISAVWNASDISAARFEDRSGGAKLATSAAVIAYGLGLAFVACAVLPKRWYACLALPVCISASVCTGYGSLEALDRAGVSVPFYSTLNTSLHAGSDQHAESDPVERQWFTQKLIENWDKRLRTVSFEPPAFGNFAGLAWPWLWYAVAVTRRNRKAFHVLLLASFSILMVGAEARTGLLLLTTDLFTLVLARMFLLPRNGRVNKTVAWAVSSTIFLVVASIIVSRALTIDDVVRGVIAGDSVSDVSRLAWQITAYRIFASNPIFGSGLGQYAFKAASYMPSWGYFSPEVRFSLTIKAPWPNTYSLYARLAAELGLVGLLGWLALWSRLIMSARGAALTYASFGRTVPAIAYALIMNCVGILVTGVTTDTFRIPMIWITLGAGVCFIARAKQLLRADSRARSMSDRVMPAIIYGPHMRPGGITRTELQASQRPAADGRRL